MPHRSPATPRPSSQAGISDTPTLALTRADVIFGKRTVLDVIVSVGGQFLLDMLGITDAINCFTNGDIGACAMLVVGILP